MGLKTKNAAGDKRKNCAPEANRSDNGRATQRSATNEEIRCRAHEIYLSQGATDGHDLEDWLQAERDLQRAEFVIDRAHQSGFSENGNESHNELNTME